MAVACAVAQSECPCGLPRVGDACQGGVWEFEKETSRTKAIGICMGLGGTGLVNTAVQKQWIGYRDNDDFGFMESHRCVLKSLKNNTNHPHGRDFDSVISRRDLRCMLNCSPGKAAFVAFHATSRISRVEKPDDIPPPHELHLSTFFLSRSSIFQLPWRETSSPNISFSVQFVSIAHCHEQYHDSINTPPPLCDGIENWMSLTPVCS